MISNECTYMNVLMYSGWAELNFENLGSSTSLAAPSGAGRHSIGSAPPATSASSTSLLSQRLSRSTLPCSVRLQYLSFTRRQHISMLCRCHVLAMAKTSVRLSVRPSVTPCCPIKTTQARITKSSLSDP